MSKKKVLFVGESSFLSTGFGTFQLEMLKRFHTSGKYELAELGTGAALTDPRAQSLDWKFYNNNCEDKDQDKYNGNPFNGQGAYRFEATLLDFKPDYVITLIDPYWYEFIVESPGRKYFRWIIDIPIDGVPQNERWLYNYRNADAALSYSSWGKSVLSSYNIKTWGVAAPGADPIYRMTKDKRQHKINMALSPDSIVIGTVMRNQRRKLYPDLIESFAHYLEEAPPDISARSLLYLHCSYPDVGWDIADLLLKYGVASRTLITYSCAKCGTTFPAIFDGIRTTCNKCGISSAYTPTWSSGASRALLCNIYNLMDVYVQYAKCEGFGMPVVEAASCGVPTIVVNYSAMEDFGEKLGSIPIPVQRYDYDPESNRMLALPDNKVLVNELVNFANKPEGVRLRMGVDSYQLARKSFSYDAAYQAFEGAVEGISPLDNWSTTTNLSQNTMFPRDCTDEEFVDIGLINVACRPELVNSYLKDRLVRDLTIGQGYERMGGFFVNDLDVANTRLIPKPFLRNDCLNIFNGLYNQVSHFEELKSL